MKMYTNIDQTAKLVEIGFKKPNGLEFLVREQDNPDNAQIVQRMAYSIGELIEMLDSIPNNMWNFIKTSERIVKVEILIFPKTKRETHYYEVCYHKELIDALFDMIVKLKEEGVI